MLSIANVINPDLTNVPCLDIETKTLVEGREEFQLQPWRIGEGKVKISCIGLGYADGRSMLTTSEYKELLQSLKGKVVYGWNLKFDVAFLIAAGFFDEVNQIIWRDGLLMWKWLDNSQYKERFPRWSLVDAAEKFCGEESWYEQFKAFKAKGENNTDDEYWAMRAKLDTVITAKVCQAIEAQLSEEKRRGVSISCATIVPFARSWVVGIPYNGGLREQLRPAITDEMKQIEAKLGFDVPAKWSPNKVLSSPKQLAQLLFTTWGLKPYSYSDKTGEPSTDKTALTYLADVDDRLLDILRWRELKTQLSKYLDSPLKAAQHLGSWVFHSEPNIFGTYTGRVTYASKTKKKYPIGAAIHQWPRNKALRKLITPFKGYRHAEFDAAGQESRLMAEFSHDPVMTDVFVNNKDFHSMTGSAISGMGYDAFIAAKEAGNERVTGEHGLRYQGKFVGLSCNYRIGVKKLRLQARVQYGMDVDYFTAKTWQDAFHNSYQNIKVYWKRQIQTSKQIGHVTTLGGRTYKLQFWSESDVWSTESSSINFPIQGTGADMKEIGIMLLHRQYPQWIFWFDLHDGLHYLVPEATTDEQIKEARDFLNKIDYQTFWHYTPTVPLTWDGSVGDNWATLKEVK